MHVKNRTHCLSSKELPKVPNFKSSNTFQRCYLGTNTEAFKGHSGLNYSKCKDLACKQHGEQYQQSICHSKTSMESFMGTECAFQCGFTFLCMLHSKHGSNYQQPQQYTFVQLSNFLLFWYMVK